MALRATFAGFYTASSGMMTSQRSLDITGQNISNVNTPGYTRQRPDIVSLTYGEHSLKYAYGRVPKVGLGSAVPTVTRMRDPFLDTRFRLEASSYGEASTKSSALSDIEYLFDETANDGMTAQLSSFVSSLQSLSMNPGNVEFDGLVQSEAQVLANMFNQYSQQLNDIRSQQEFQLNEVAIVTVNDLLTNIAMVTENIRSAEVTGRPILELYDERDLMIDQLSEFMKIDVKYTPQEAFPGVYVNDLKITMLGAKGDKISLLEIAQVENDPKIKEVNQLYYNKLQDGSISITIGEDEASAFVHDITDKIANGSLKGLLDVLNKSGDYDVPATDFRGIGYYEKALDTLASKIAEEMNKANNIQGEGINRDLFSSKDGGPITASSICLSQGWLNGKYGITTSKPPYLSGDNSGQQNNVLNMISIFNSSHDYTYSGDHCSVPAGSGTFHEFLARTANNLFLDIDAINSTYTNYANIMDGIETLREGISAVSLDEEGVNLLRFQKSYNAAARVMTTMDECLDTLISRTGIVGR